ncbi:MAG: 50S ribosomal protein L9 [Desulfobacterales bacterium]|jgi:large subunit ribosomal protein L9|nr:50S ribosomal protein L9 [Desulfobacterales bacterium]MDP4978856.1 50S ribosomal protein L9 [Desulfobacterales bacterium]
MKVLLTETIDSLGIIGSEVDVAKGYARNYLIPQKKALIATPQNRKQLEQVKAKFELQIAKEKKIAEEMAEKLQGVAVTIPAKVSEEDRLYGSISVRDIIEALDKQNITVEKRMVLLTDPIKQIGTYMVPIRVYKDVEPEITVEIVPES